MLHNNDRHPITILLVEDDPGHARLIQKNLRRARVDNTVIHLGGGQQVLDLLFEEGSYAGKPRPPHPMVLLDINMPGIDGYQVLERLKADPRTHRIPVIMLTTTDDQQEVARCYQLGCSVYITKPIDYEAFSRAVAELGLFFSIITVPA